MYDGDLVRKSGHGAGRWNLCRTRRIGLAAAKDAALDLAIGPGHRAGVVTRSWAFPRRAPDEATACQRQGPTQFDLFLAFVVATNDAKPPRLGRASRSPPPPR